MLQFRFDFDSRTRSGIRAISAIQIGENLSGRTHLRVAKRMVKGEFLTTGGCTMHHTAVGMRFPPSYCRRYNSFRVA